MTSRTSLPDQKPSVPFLAGGVGAAGHAAGYAVPLALMLGAAATLIFARPTMPMDDAYITLHNARALLAGGWDASYGTSALTGATSAVHLLLIALLGLAMPLVVASHCVTLLAFGAYLAGLQRMALQAGANPALILILGSLFGYLPFQLLNGLETGLAMAAVAWALALANHRHLPILLGLLPFVRPELVVLSALMMARRGWMQRAAPIFVLREIAVAALAAAPFLLLYWVLTGSPSPNTGSAKVAFFAEQRLAFGHKAFLGVDALTESLLFPLLIGVLGYRRAPAGGVAALFLIIWLLVAITKLPSGLYHNHARYLSLMVPALLYGLCYLLPITTLRRPLAITLLGCVLLSAPHGLRAAFTGGQPPQFLALAQGVVPKIPQGARVLLHDAGYLPWLRPDLHLTDAVGLKTASSATVHARLTALSGQRGAALDQIARQSGADYLVVLSADSFWSTIGTGLSAGGWVLDPVSVSSAGYSLYRLAPPAG